MRSWFILSFLNLHLGYSRYLLFIFNCNLLLFLSCCLNLLINPVVKFHVLFLLFLNGRSLRDMPLALICLPLFFSFFLQFFKLFTLLLDFTLQLLSGQILFLLNCEFFHKFAHIIIILLLVLLLLQLFFKLFFPPTKLLLL